MRAFRLTEDRAAVRLPRQKEAYQKHGKTKEKRHPTRHYAHFAGDHPDRRPGRHRRTVRPDPVPGRNIRITIRISKPPGQPHLTGRFIFHARSNQKTNPRSSVSDRGFERRKTFAVDHPKKKLQSSASDRNFARRRDGAGER